MIGFVYCIPVFDCGMFMIELQDSDGFMIELFQVTQIQYRRLL